MTALYIHWPFCRKKCPYCDFNSHVRASVDYDRWRAAMLTELRYMATKMPRAALTSIFFGGGTPSLMPPFIVEALLKEAEALWRFTPEIEITLEANPTSSESANFQAYRDAGVNRLSLGVQSLVAEDLAFLGREHAAEEALEVVALAASIFPRYSFDLIYARPHQTSSAWEKELTTALHYARGHLSLYQLTVEDETPFARLYAAGGFTLPDDETATELYHITQSLCAEAGMHAYEVSNYAAKGQESRHNMSYWNGDAYLGVGAGAHGRLLHANGAWSATNTIKSPEKWIEAVEAHGHAIEQEEWLSADERAEEILLGGLRLRDGIAFDKVKAAIQPHKLTLLEAQGLIRLKEGQLTVTPQGWMVLERIISELLV
jgi:putative oxygen-independent coproporphyrinogen III oxidase